MKCRGSRSSPWALRLRYLLAAASALAFSVVAQAADGPSRKAAAPAMKYSPPANVRIISIPLPEECPADDNAAMNGMKAFIDPATGELSAPTAEAEAALARAMAGEGRIRAQAAHEAVVGANGGVHYYLGEDGMVDSVLRIGPDGKPVFVCVPRSETPKALTRPLAPKKNEAAKEEK